MKQTIITCDRCKENKSTDGEVISFQVIYGGRVAQSGDLCKPCADRVLSDFNDLILMKPVEVGFHRRPQDGPMNTKLIRQQTMSLFNGLVRDLPKNEYLELLIQLESDFTCLIDCVKEELENEP